MVGLSNRYDTTVSIEPILDFDNNELISWIRNIHPKFVSIGADSQHYNLPEPNPARIEDLIFRLKAFTEVRIKSNLRRLRKMKIVPRPEGQQAMSYERLGGSCSHHPKKKIYATLDDWFPSTESIKKSKRKKTKSEMLHEMELVKNNNGLGKSTLGSEHKLGKNPGDVWEI